MNLSKYDFDIFFEFYDVTEDGRVFEKTSGEENIFSEIDYVLEGQSTIEKRFINTKSTE